MEEPLKALCRSLEESIRVKRDILADSGLLERVIQVGGIMADAFKGGNKVLFGGNGGSAADAQHLAAELVSRFAFDRPGLPALSLSTDTSILTAVSNDYGYEHLFRRQLEALARRGDVFVGITTSGKSKNVLNAFRACRALGVTSVALCGRGGELEQEADHVLRAPSTSTPRIQEAHIALGHMLCSHVELALFSHLQPR